MRNPLILEDLLDLSQIYQIVVVSGSITLIAAIPYRSNGVYHISLRVLALARLHTLRVAGPLPRYLVAHCQPRPAWCGAKHTLAPHQAGLSLLRKKVGAVCVLPLAPHKTRG